MRSLAVSYPYRGPDATPRRWGLPVLDPAFCYSALTGRATLYRGSPFCCLSAVSERCIRRCPVTRSKGACACLRSSRHWTRGLSCGILAPCLVVKHIVTQPYRLRQGPQHRVCGPFFIPEFNKLQHSVDTRPEPFWVGPRT